jgi:hypothetical protein
MIKHSTATAVAKFHQHEIYYYTLSVNSGTSNIHLLKLLSYIVYLPSVVFNKFIICDSPFFGQRQGCHGSCLFLILFCKTCQNLCIVYVMFGNKQINAAKLTFTPSRSCKHIESSRVMKVRFFPVLARRKQMDASTNCPGRNTLGSVAVKVLRLKIISF